MVANAIKHCTLAAAIQEAVSLLPASSSQKGVRSRTKNIECILQAMTRTLWLEFSNALHYVTSRRDHR